MNEVYDERSKWRLERLRKRIKLIDVAQALGITASYISQHESGKLNLSEAQYEKYVNYIVSNKNG
ncbi:hypothetical protein D3C74_491880 [compost metagenome]